MRYLYLAALLRLDERGQLRYNRALTNREYLDRVQDNPHLQAALPPIVETFDRVWYGYAPSIRWPLRPTDPVLSGWGRDESALRRDILILVGLFLRTGAVYCLWPRPPAATAAKRADNSFDR